MLRHIHPLACALLSGIALLAASPALGQEKLSCAGLSGSSVVGYAYLGTPLNQGAPPPLDLRLRLEPDGTARIHGILRVREDGPLLSITSRVVPVCDDADGDGALGVVRVGADFWNRTTGEIVPVVLTTPGQDIDTTGTYLVVVEVGSEVMTLETLVRVDLR